MLDDLMSDQGQSTGTLDVRNKDSEEKDKVMLKKRRADKGRSAAPQQQQEQEEGEQEVEEERGGDGDGSESNSNYDEDEIGGNDDDDYDDDGDMAKNISGGAVLSAGRERGGTTSSNTTSVDEVDKAEDESGQQQKASMDAPTSSTPHKRALSSDAKIGKSSKHLAHSNIQGASLHYSTFNSRTSSPAKANISASGGMPNMGHSIRNPLMSLLNSSTSTIATMNTAAAVTTNAMPNAANASRVMDLVEKVSVLKRMLLSERHQHLVERQQWSRFTTNLAEMKQVLAAKEHEITQMRETERKLRNYASASEEQQLLAERQELHQLGTAVATKDTTTRDDSSKLSSSMPSAAKVDKTVPPMIKSSSSSSTSHRFFKGFMGNRPVQEQLQLAQQEMGELRESKITLLEQHRERIEDMQSLVDVKTRMLEETASQLAQYREREHELGEENSMLQIQVANMMHGKRQSEMHVQTLQDRVREMERLFTMQTTDLKQQLQHKDEEIERLTDELSAKSKTVDNMARQLMEMKQHMQSLSLMLRKFSVRSVGKSGKRSETHLHLQKNPSTGMLTLNIISAGKSTVFPLTSVDTVEKHQNSGNRFDVVLPNGKHTFETTDEEEREEILSTLREFIKAQAEEDEQRERA